MILRTPDEVNARLTQVMEAFTQNVATKVQQSVKEKTPIKSGEARDGWEKEEVSALTINVVNDVPYIGVLEYGNDHHEAHNMVADTLANAESIIASSIPNLTEI